ncbi:Type II secretion system protein D [wastewater metagenome]|uniref:Type II secretion system protein D n=2 Tax=unclassified sequences TaxID=12908 RepID=A0A5B8RIK5_9ZZZZ|nr:type II secretion system protein D [uncultured organism]
MAAWFHALRWRPTPLRAAAALLALVAVVAAGNAGAQEQITLNLKGAQLSTLVDTVAEITGRNFVLDPRVNARVTVISRRPMDADALYQVFLSILQVHGFSAIPAGEVTKIVPDVNARQLASEGGVNTGDAVVTRVLTVENVPVAQLVPILRPLVPQQGHFAAYAPTNSLIISDHASNVARIADVVHKIDRAGATATEVIPLEHASAETAAETVNDVTGSRGEEASGAQAVRVAADKRINALVVMGTDTQRARVRRLAERLDAEADQGGDTRVVYLSYAKAEDVAEVLQSVSEDLPAAGTGAGGGDAGAATAGVGNAVSIQADAATNSLVISAPPAVQNELAAVIDKLDIRRAQVLIEAAIAEVSADMAAELGFQWAVDGGNGNTAVGGTSFANNSVSGGDSLAGIIGSLSRQEVPNIGQGLSLAVGDLAGGVRFAALLRALASDADTNILSTPSLVTLDNQEAEITVAQNVPFVTGSYTTDSSDSSNVNPFQTIERRDVGLILKVKPQINEGDSVMLEIQQEVSNVSESTRAVDLITDKRSISTSVLVDSGRLVVLGGLLDEQVRETEQRVPLLGSIPVLGNLFRYRSAQSEKRNLMVFLRPRIVRDEATMTRYASDKYASMRARQRAQRDAGVALLPDDVAPVLPPLGRPALPAPFTRGR